MNTATKPEYAISTHHFTVTVMLPLVDPEVLLANPKFGALYQDLTSNKLSEDATTKLDVKGQREHDALAEELRSARIEVAKQDLLKNGLETLSYRPEELPDEVREAKLFWSFMYNAIDLAQLQEVVAVAAAVLDGQISADDRELLQGDFQKFKDNIEKIAGLLSDHFRQEAETLAAMVDPDDPPAIRNLTTSLRKMQTSVTLQRSTISQHRFELAAEITKLYHLHRQVLETSIRILEQTIHGSVARGSKAKADYLAQVAEGMSKKLRLRHVQLTSQLYSADVQEALQVKLSNMERDIHTVKQKLRTADEKLDDYRRNPVMSGLAAEYAEILKETEKVKMEIA